MKFTFAPQTRPLPGYTLLRGIHRGGFGEVYQGVSDGGKSVALKLLHDNHQIELRGVRQCLNLKHRNLVNLFDVVQDADGDYWVVMEYVNGVTLDDVLATFPKGLPLGEVRDWMAGIAAGVDFLHSRGIIHRDLKPSNLYQEDGQVKVGDVGLSKLSEADRKDTHTQSIGTVYYMAPEIAHGHYGTSVDVYSAGVILCEMLTGRLPFTGESAAEVMMKHLTAVPDVSQVPTPLRKVVLKALAKDPRERYGSVGELLAAFEKAADLPQTTATEPAAGRPPHSTRETGRSPYGTGRPVFSGAAAVAPCGFAAPSLPAAPLWWQESTPVRKGVIVGIAVAMLAMMSGEGGMRGAALLGLVVGVAVTNIVKWRDVTRYRPNEFPRTSPHPSRHRQSPFHPGAVPPGRRAEPITTWVDAPTASATVYPPARVAAAARAPAFARPPSSSELRDWWLSSLIRAPFLVALLVGGIEAFSRLINGRPHFETPGVAVLFGTVSVLCVWLLQTLVPVFNPPGRKAKGQFWAFAVGGFLVGVTGFFLTQYLMTDLGSVERGLGAVRSIGVRPLIEQATKQPTALGWGMFFAALFAVVPWRRQVTFGRGRRFRVWSLAAAIAIAWGCLAVFPFPLVPGLLFAGVVSCAAQLATTAAPERYHIRSARA